MHEIRNICSLLEADYGRPEFVRDLRPLDELVLTILSQNTSAVNYRRAFQSLRERFPSWEEVRDADPADVEDVIRPGGLARTKTAVIREVLEEIRARYRSLDLDFLKEMPDTQALSFLMEFSGVGIKTASCVLMFSLGRPVFPVDTHVHRISKRLGLIGESVSAEEAHRVMGEIVPDELVYSLHVNLVTHGRQVCKARNPACDVCSLLPMCPVGQSLMASGGA